MNLKFILTILFFTLIFCNSVFAHVRKFNQHDFDKWLDEENFLVVLFCSSVKDKICIKEREKLNTLSEEVISHNDIIFGYIDKESDAILISRYDVQKFPVIKFFPYNNSPQNYFLNIRIKDLKEKILEVKNEFFEKVQQSKAEKKIVSRPKRISLNEIDWMDMSTTVKDPEKHAILVLYDDDCFEPCKVMEKVAKVFEEESEVGFYKLSLEKAGPLKNSLSFSKNPTILWYPKTDKNGFIYGGKITLEMMVEYINDHAGLSRSYNGELKQDAGRIAEIDQIIQENIIAILLKTKIDYVIHLVQKKGKELPHNKKFIDYYLAIIMEIKKGVDPDQVLLREQDFLFKRMSKSNENDKEMNEWKKYYNIISAFVDFAASKLQTDQEQETPQKETVRNKAQLKQDLKWKHPSHHDEL